MIIMTKHKEQETFSQRLRVARKDKGLTQANLSELTGISRRAIAHYESQGKQPPVKNLKKLAEAIGTTVDSLVGAVLDSGNRKDKLSYSISKKVKVIEKLPVRDQKAIFRLINSLAEKNKIRG